MSEFEQMLDESFKTIKNGEVVKGTVISVRDTDLVVNIGYKHDALLSRTELSIDPEAKLQDLYKQGDEITAKVAKVNDGEGNVILTMRKVYTERTSEALEAACQNETPVTAVVDEVVKKKITDGEEEKFENAGLSLTVDGVKIFMPISLVAERFERDIEKYVGQELTFLVTEYNPKKHKVIGNRKKLLQKERKERLDAILESLHEFDIVEGTVKTVTEFGVFVDLGGADGLLHVSELGWTRIPNPKKVFKPGDPVRAFVKSINGEKIGLSRKFPDENPWVDADVKFAPGNVVTGKVARLTDFGAFVNLEEGIDGLVHVSQISWNRVEKPSDVLEQGQEVTAKILAFDPETKKISLSMKALQPKQEHSDKKPRNRGPKEEVMENADGTLNIEKYLAKMDREEELKAKAEAKAAEAEAKAEEAVKEAEAKVEETVAEAETKVEETVAEAETKVEEAAEAVEAKAEEVVAEEKKEEA